MTRWVYIVVLAACGSGPGVDGDKRITALDDGEIHDLCDYIVELYGPSRTIDCGTGTITFGGLDADVCFADMIAFQSRYPGCEATVDDKTACEEAIAHASDSQICNSDGEVPPVCAPVFTVECGGG